MRTIERLKADLQIPERFSECTFENYVPDCEEAKRALKVCQAYASKWPERLQRGGGLVMCGKPGTGKTIWRWLSQRASLSLTRAQQRSLLR